MARAIDNKEKMMIDSLSNALQTADSIDIKVGYFYFSGFQSLAKVLADKKVRILIGKEIDPQCIPLIVNSSLDRNQDLAAYGYRGTRSNSVTKRKNDYLETLIGFVNNSDVFDSEEDTNAFKLFIEKIENGTLEIRQSTEDFHDKFYIIKNKESLSQNGDNPGTVIMGSSNFTYYGLKGQGENNEEFRDVTKFEEYVSKFDPIWNSSEKSFSLAMKEDSAEFVRVIKEKTYFYKQPKPYEMYIRVLHELYSKSPELESIRTASKITHGEFMDFEYQNDAVKIALDRLEKFDGVIIADVVGLGKSIIGSTVANNLDLNTVIIAPPHLIPQWEDYKEKFGIRGSKIFSSGNIKEVFERYRHSLQPILIIIDEAHRFRNEDTSDYKQLHQICRSNPGNKVVLLTATPFNNSPQDIFALMKFFQTPGQSTIRSIDNLSLRFRELISKYKKLRADLRKNPKSDFAHESSEISFEQRKFLEPIVIRRSRLDLEHITRYRKDLERQNISFPKIVGPVLLEYDLGDLADLYLQTLNALNDNDDDSNDSYKGARYKPSTYILEPEKFLKKYPELDNYDLQVGQKNLATFMRRLLVTRFESSKYAFKSTLNRMIENNKLIVSWWDNLKIVPIMKKGQLFNPEDFADFSFEDGEISDDLEAELAKLRESKGLIEIPTEWMDLKFIADVKQDIYILEKIYANWFGDGVVNEADPKLDKLESEISTLLRENSVRKIVIFSAYADTVDYIYDSLTQRGVQGLLPFTSSLSNKESRKVLLSNFDASIPDGKQSNDYQILVCTDALSEGVNLHRAGVVINYDIHYNPTRVIQRIGRINRINKKVFDSIHIFNFFPTVVGDSEIRIKAISTLKINLINSIVGTDTRVLTPDEDLQTFFVDELRKADESEEYLSWDAQYLEDYDAAMKNGEIIKSIEDIPHRTRISRKANGEQKGVIFSKRGESSVFVLSTIENQGQVISTEEALSYFRADQAEESFATSARFPELFEIAKNKLDEKHVLPEIKGRRADVLQVLQALRGVLPESANYCADLSKVIREFDDVSDGTLKDIAQLRIEDPKELFSEIKSLIPEGFIQNVFDRVKRLDNQSEVILLSEEFI